MNLKNVLRPDKEKNLIYGAILIISIICLSVLFLEGNQFYACSSLQHFFLSSRFIIT
jgi:hypothetical protein